MSKFFRNASTDLLHRDRQAHLERMAQSMLDFAEENGNGHDYAIDMATQDDDLFDDWDNDCRTFENDAFGIGGEGRLDLLGMLAQEVFDHEKLENFFGFDEAKMAEEIATKGLHGLHFRMDFPSFGDRKFYTSLVAEAFGDIRSFPLDALSACTADDAEVMVYRYEYNENEDYQKLSDEQIYTLFRLDSRKAPKWTVESFREAIDHYLDSPELTFSQILDNDGLAGFQGMTAIQRIEGAFMHLVYNLGYRLKLMGYDNVTVMDEVSPTIDYLIGKVTQDKEFSDSLKRQVLINLFSAFPSGLKLVDAKIEELHGVTLDQNLIGHPLSEPFKRTLAGPLVLFAGGFDTTNTHHTVTPMMCFLASAGYEISFDVSASVELSRSVQANILLRSQHPLKVIEEIGAKGIANNEGAFGFPNVKEVILSPEILKAYTDQVVYELIIANTSYLEVSNLNEDDRPHRAGLKPLGGFLLERPELRKRLMEDTADQGVLTHKIFRILGGVAADLRALGSKAPAELKDAYLAADLGL